MCVCVCVCVACVCVCFERLCVKISRSANHLKFVF